ncbi:MAG: U32 family peptidase C-terminal domain-containing protein, partial [bacterium]|nr:U32 family peptidase C-terminal domain-containing protein [bacterium]
FWRKAGVGRIILGREISLKDIRAIKDNVPDVELEIFCHGSMCVSYSGRCLLSSVMTGRSANEGKCAHPCRWNYYLVEEKRPGEYFPIESSDKGSYILNSKDLNMIDYIPEIAAAGVDSIKIEGRMKSLYYLACVVRAYRKALDCYESREKLPKKVTEELEKISHRKYTTGFYVDNSCRDMQVADTSEYEKKYDFLGIVKKVAGGTATLEARNKIRRGDSVEIIGSDIEHDRKEKIKSLFDCRGESLNEANPGMKIKVRLRCRAVAGDLIRKKNEQ